MELQDKLKISATWILKNEGNMFINNDSLEQNASKATEFEFNNQIYFQEAKYNINRLDWFKADATDAAMRTRKINQYLDKITKKYNINLTEKEKALIFSYIFSFEDMEFNLDEIKDVNKEHQDSLIMPYGDLTPETTEETKIYALCVLATRLREPYKKND